MEHLSNDHEDCPNQHENSHELYDETGHPVLSLMKSQWKLRQQHDYCLTTTLIIWVRSPDLSVPPKQVGQS